MQLLWSDYECCERKVLRYILIGAQVFLKVSSDYTRDGTWHVMQPETYSSYHSVMVDKISITLRSVRQGSRCVAQKQK